MNLGEPFAALAPLPALHYRTELVDRLMGELLSGALEDHQTDNQIPGAGIRRIDYDGP